jgi:hypothetical protein
MNPATPAQMSSSGSNAVTQNTNNILTALFGQSMPLPSLYNYRDPRAFGASGNGATDDSSAFQAAINAGDILVTPGTYLINGTVLVPGSRTIQCQPGAILYTSQKNGNNTAILRVQSSYNTVIGCTFEGGNNGSANTYSDALEFNMAIQLWAPGSHNTLVGNTFKYFWGNAAISIYGGADGSSDNNVVSLNNFENNGLYGTAIVDARNTTMNYNHFLNSQAGTEPDNVGQNNTGNVMQHNVLEGDGSFSNSTVNLRIGGYPPNFDYTGNHADFNLIQGTGSSVILNWGWTPSAQQTKVYANQCINGCNQL